MIKLSTLLLATAAVLPAAPALAQTDQTAPDDITVADYRAAPIIVVASGVPQYQQDIGRAITVLDRAEIEARQTIAVADLLATTPGVTVTRNGGPGAVTAARIRGAEGEQTLVLVDGVRVNDPSSPGGAFDFGNLLANSVERIEVLRGPNSVAWGSQAIGGVVNVVTEQPVHGITARGNAEYGSDNQVNAVAAIAAGDDQVHGAVTAGYFRTDGISQAAVGTEKDGYRQFGATAKLGFDFTPDIGADFRLYYAHSKLDLDGFPAPTFSFADTPEYSEAQELYAYAGAHANIGRLHNRFSFTLADINRDNYDPSVGDDPSFFSRGRSERYTYQGDADFGIARLVFGAEQENSRFYDGGRTQRQDITSVYGEAILKPVEMLTVTAGVRNDDHSGFGSHWTWSANAALRPTDTTVLRASYGEGFKAPTLYQRFSFYGTPDLRPETAKSYEFGAEQQLFDGVKLAATWFHRDIEDQIDFDLASFTYFNIARSRAEGVEVELVAQPFTGLSLRGSYSHVDAQNRSFGPTYGRDLARRPQDSGSLSADYRFGDRGPSIGGTVLVVGNSFDDPANTVRLDSYFLASLRASVPVTDNVELYGRVENLFDETYETVAGYGTLGRSAYAGIRLRFQ